MKTINTSILLFFLFCGFCTSSVSALEGLSANVAGTSNYLWRGLEQTGGKAAVSGGIDYDIGSGFYVGTWLSDADWAEEMTYELDVYGGFSGNISDSMTYDVGFTHYAYPDAVANLDFTEVNASLGFGAFSISYVVLVDAEGADAGDDSYISADAEFEVATDLALALHVGTGTDEFYAGESFVEYGASLSKDVLFLGSLLPI
ncbi:TorF family putative porin [Thalassotalea sp. ND16A]|uniref:TorF family putative porin n=1 Tax=Thalassotalea sp. ND16A TaxID=1535422 RepID=UPI00051CCB09|nr:TorF family putative porin [Thalassotalea sp. ND16A]KGJ98465.1 hypothetical protein ND16A_0654 [Thalassotalea sp. ND16A]